MTGNIMKLNELPVIFLTQSTMPFPGVTSRVLMSTPYGKQLVRDVDRSGIPYVFAVMAKQGANSFPDGFYEEGVVSELEVIDEVNDKPVIMLSGEYCAKVLRYFKKDKSAKGYWIASTSPYADTQEEFFEHKNGDYVVREKYQKNIRGIMFEIKKGLSALAETMLDEDDADGASIRDVVNNFDNYDFTKVGAIYYFIWQILATIPDATPEEKQNILKSVNISERLGLILELIVLNLEIILSTKKMRDRIDKKVEEKLESGERTRTNKPTSLTTKKGSQDFLKGLDRDTSEKYKKYLDMEERLHPDVQKAFMEDFWRLKSSSPGHHDWDVYNTHLDFLLNLYSATESVQENDMTKIENYLDQSHYGLTDVKDRIYNYIAAKILNPKGKGPIICLVGPPGVGKTSIGKSIAESLGRKFIRLSLGGLRDEAEIKGHRRTYIGALAGTILVNIKRHGATNPVFMLDEIDKLRNDFRGDPSSALLEVLDPEQNHSFQDLYVGAPFDLSKVLFVCTANSTSTIQPALLDRMNLITLSGYTEEEKVQIAKKFLIPKLSESTGLTQNNVKISWPEKDPSSMLPYIISGYTREAGVRKLEQRIQQLFENFAREHLRSGRKETSIEVNEAVVNKLLHQPPYLHERAEVTEVGEAIGLAWTPVGGDIMYIHAQLTHRNPGDKQLSQTGGLRETFIEANKNAVTVAKNLLKDDIKALSKLEKNMLHLSVPDLAIPKDGPSAGIAMTMAIYSELTGKVIKPYIAMTGEITTKGRIRAIGGVKSKVLAARRDGIKEIILPKTNERDVLQDVPKVVQDDLTFHYVSRVTEVLPIIFPEPNDRPVSEAP